MEELKNKLNEIAKTQMKYADMNGSTKLSTCDHRGWDKDVWNHRGAIIEKIRDSGYNISVSVSWGVTDILITKPITL